METLQKTSTCHGQAAMQHPLVSVVMPAYNAEKYIGEAIRSVQLQTYTNWVLLVIDDCSTDHTVDVVQAFVNTDDRIRLFRNTRNLGAAKTRNRGLELSEGETKHESVEEQVNGDIQSMITPINSSSTPLFADFCTIYLAAKKENISSTTYLLYETAIQRILIPRLGHLHLDEIKPYHVQELINFLATPSGRVDKKGEKLAPATIRRYLTILQSIMTMAWKQEYINSNPADTRRLEISKIVTPEVEAFSNEEIAEILKMAQLEPIHIHAVIATAIYTGARRGEIAGLKWEDIDFEKRTMYIRRSVVKLAQQEPEIKLPKTISSIRQIAIPQALCDILQELKKEQDRKKALLGEKWHEEGFLFTDWCGHVMHPHTPTKQFDKFLKKYGFRHLKFHGLRHSSATYLLSNGCDIKTVSKRLGHTSIDTTNIYVHALERTDKAAAACFDSIEV